MPQNAAGRETEPAVWVPTASGTMPAATAAAGPLEEPPGVCPSAWGLRVGGGRSKKANSVVCTLPTTTAPAARRAATIQASAPAGGASARVGLPAQVGSPATSITSLIATGMPCSRPRQRPASASASQAAASTRAEASVTRQNAWTSPSIAAIRARQRSTSALAVSPPLRSSAARPATRPGSATVGSSGGGSGRGRWDWDMPDHRPAAGRRQAGPRAAAAAARCFGHSGCGPKQVRWRRVGVTAGSRDGLSAAGAAGAAASRRAIAARCVNEAVGAGRSA